MQIFGWIMLIVLATFGALMLVLFTLPFVITECKMFQEKIKKAIEDKKLDLQKRSEERKNRDSLKREKDFELANRKLDAKILKVDKKIKLQQKKLDLAKELKEVTQARKETLQKDSLENPVAQEEIALDYYDTDIDCETQDKQLDE